MFIILLAHIPNNTWHNWIPARFGFSDAADLFVFCSGMASALAFGSVFATRGWLMGTARILHRIWQVYWAHIGSCLVVLSIVVAADRLLGTNEYVTKFTFDRILDAAPDRLLQLMTLRYIPELYFDILPMYLVLLAMTPFAMALAQAHRALVFVAMLALWALAYIGGVNPHAQPEGGRDWFFNPLAWQIIFFSGFALMRGWWPTPPRSLILLSVCAIFVGASALIACQPEYYCYAGFGHVPAFGEMQQALKGWTDKTSQGPLRYLHFMATVYIAWYVCGVDGARLQGAVVEVIRKVGTQTLAVFLTTLIVAPLLGVAIEQIDRDNGWIIAAANIAGLLTLIVAGRVTAWFKSAPWRMPAGAK